MKDINNTHQSYGLIGYPLGHSFSKGYFAGKFQREGIDATYDNYEIRDANMLQEVVRTHPTLRGLNCTIPHKQAIVPMMDDLSPEAAEIGAVNVIKIRRMAEGKIHLTGHNTDTIGFSKSIKPLLKPHHRKALVLGTGGASHAICYGLTQLGLQWTYVSRSKQPGRLTYNELTPQLMDEYTVVVNCSPVGMYPHVDEAPRLPYEAMSPRHLLFDLVYNPLVTRFLELGAHQGAITKNGLEMLHLQAEASWEIWQEP